MEGRKEGGETKWIKAGSGGEKERKEGQWTGVGS